MTIIKNLILAFIFLVNADCIVAVAAQANDSGDTSAEAVNQAVSSAIETDLAEVGPYYKDVTISPDGQFIAALVANNGRYNLALFERQRLTRAYFVTDFSDADIDGYVWANNQHLVFSIDFTSQGGTSLYSVARDGEQPIYTIAEGKINANQQVVAAEIAALVPAVEDQIIIRYNRANPEFADYYRARVSDGTLLSRVKGLPKSTLNAWFDAKGEARLLLQQQKQGLALQQRFQDKPKTVLASTDEPFELMPLALAAAPNQAWVFYQPADKPTGVFLYDVVEQKFLRELNTLRGEVVSKLEIGEKSGEPLWAQLAQGQVWLESSEQAFFQQLQLLFPQKTIRELSRSNDGNWLTILVTDTDNSQSYYLVDRQDNLVNLLFVADDEATSVQ